MSAARFAIEFRTRSRRTPSGWTKWQHYIVAQTQEDAERICSTDWMRHWMRDAEGELRIVDRKQASAGRSSGEAVSPDKEKE